MLLGLTFVSLSRLLVSCLIWIFSRFSRCFRLSDCLCMLLFVYARLPGCEACYYESLEFADRQQGKLHFDHTLLYPIFTMP